uniref:Uncharacterized protein n=1 Tax=Oryza sativa subsp. japonica TaxID=39947 RepID=Q7F232_ORYSJ|nr:hypothetical protein [Oryza sativa Japonica Group]BAD30222.1 hypothetical protein [Oryza sativa Japonica Group]
MKDLSHNRSIHQLPKMVTNYLSREEIYKKEEENQTRIRTYRVLDPKTQLNTFKWDKHPYQYNEGPEMSVQAKTGAKEAGQSSAEP